MKKRISKLIAILVMATAMTLNVAPGTYAASTPSQPAPLSAGHGAKPVVNGVVSPLAVTTYTTNNSCVFDDPNNGLTTLYASVTWQLNGNYDRPISVYWSTNNVLVSSLNLYWEQGSYVSQHEYDQYPTFTASGALTLDQNVYQWLYWPGHDNYERIYFYYGYNSNGYMCQVKVTDGR